MRIKLKNGKKLLYLLTYDSVWVYNKIIKTFKQGDKMEFWRTMLESLSENALIVVGAAVAVCLFAISLAMSNGVKNYFEGTQEKGLKSHNYYILDVSYTLFITVVSLFPLLGMFGTVQALINLGGVFQTENADMNSIKPSFFLALTSTAWGILCSIFFKTVNSIFQPFIENQIEKAKKALDI